MIYRGSKGTIRATGYKKATGQGASVGLHTAWALSCLPSCIALYAGYEVEFALGTFC